jgi:fructokinase
MILCCGEALIDMIPTPTQSGLEGFVPHSGGAIFNTAIGLGRLGVQTGMLSGVSDDLFGQQLVTSLKASHVDTSLLIRSERPSTLAFVQLTDGQATYTFFDENSAGGMITGRELPDIPPDVTALYFGGISLCAEPAADTYLGLAEKVNVDRVIMLDPNIRPSFINNIETYRARLEKFISLADIVKVSDEDLNWILPGSQSFAEKLDLVLKAGPSIVILTRGRNGASAIFRDGSEISVAAANVDVVDTVGAGDSFNSGMLAKLAEMGQLTKDALISLEPEQFYTALRFAAKVAAVTVSRSGANPPWAHELDV